MLSDAQMSAVRRFIARYIRSVEQLEILCLLAKDPAKPWPVAEVFRSIQSSDSSVAACLAAFEQAGLLRCEAGDRYRFAPREPALGEAVGLLAQAYRERRVSVVELIYQQPAAPIQDFAEAFRLRKRK